MPSTFTRRLVRVPIRALAALLATVAAAAAVWHGGLSVLHWVGVANPARGDTGTALGLGAAAIGSSVVPTWLTARYYFESKDRLSRSSERTAASADVATDTADETPEVTTNVSSDDHAEDTGAPTVEVVDSIDTETTGCGGGTVDENLVAAAENVPLLSDLYDSNSTRNTDLQKAVRRMFGPRDR
jgi:hypothetical protein